MNIICIYNILYHSIYVSLSSSSLSCHQTIIFHTSAHCFPTSLNVIRSSKEQGYCASCEHCNMYTLVSSAFPQTHVVSPVLNFHFFLCAKLHVHRRLRTSPRGPCTIVTFRYHFVKVNDVYVRFIAQFLPPFAASVSVCEHVSLCVGQSVNMYHYV